MFYWLFKYSLFTPWIYTLIRPKLEHRDRVPASGGVILAANHASAVETLLLPGVVPRKVVFPAKSDLFRKRKGDWKHNIVAWFLRAIGQVPVDRSGGRASVDSMRPVAETLRAGHVVGIFPEGTRTPDGRLYRGKTGVARLALLTGSPVIPVGMRHTNPRSVLDLLRHRPVISFGEPVSYAQFAGRENDREVLRWVTDDVMARIQELTGQDYVDVYAGSVKRGDVAVSPDKLLATPHEGKTPPAPSDEIHEPAIPAAPPEPGDERAPEAARPSEPTA